ncbi:unnamed protein product, partial [Durusdinium trenchii]
FHMPTRMPSGMARRADVFRSVPANRCTSASRTSSCLWTRRRVQTPLAAFALLQRSMACLCGKTGMQMPRVMKRMSRVFLATSSMACWRLGKAKARRTGALGPPNRASIMRCWDAKMMLRAS